MDETKEDGETRRREKRIKRIRDAKELQRDGYWQCEHCSCHNEDVLDRCANCGRARER